MSANQRNKSSVGLFLLSLTLTVLGISVTYGPMVLSLMFYGSAVVIGCIAAARSTTDGAARKAASCGFVVVAVATPWMLPILMGEPAGYAIVIGIYGPAVSFLAFSWAYLIARSSKPWPFIAAVGLAAVLVPAPHKVMIPISGVLRNSPVIGYLWVGLVIAFAIMCFLLVVLLTAEAKAGVQGAQHWGTNRRLRTRRRKIYYNPKDNEVTPPRGTSKTKKSRDTVGAMSRDNTWCPEGDLNPHVR